MPGNGRLCWNVRIKPRAAILCGGSPRIDSPAKRTSPLLAGKAPAMMLKVVLFPAPFGPITPRISPSRTSKSSPVTAVRPPKRFVRFLTSSTTEGIVQTDQTLRLQENRRDHQRAEDEHVVVPH